VLDLALTSHLKSQYLAAIRTTNTSKVQRRRVHSTMVIRSEGDEPITVEQFWWAGI
jgi:hypothetical protein